MEEFRTVEGFDNYEVSNLGNVKSNTASSKGKLLKPGKDAMGYLHVRMYDPNDTRKYANGNKYAKLEKIHRLVAEAFIPRPNSDKYLEINHKNGDKTDNRVENLEWVTRGQNIRHAHKTGLFDEGIKQGGMTRRKLMKITYSDGSVTYIKGVLAAAFVLGVSAITIRRYALNGLTYREGWTVEYVDEMPFDEVAKVIDRVEKLINEYNNKYVRPRNKYKKK